MRLSRILKFLIILTILLFILHYFIGLDILISKLSDIDLDFLTTKLKELVTILENSLSRIKELFRWLKDIISGDLGISLESYNTERVSANVINVIDGDTIIVKIERREYKVRYIGIDAPEMDNSEKPAEFMSKEAFEKNKELVMGKIVKLEKDISETDKHGRLLRYVYIGDLMINAEMVRFGYAYAKSYPPDVKYDDLLLKLQRKAKEAGLGLWRKNVDIIDLKKK